MDPPLPWRAPARRRFPRPRGDGPRDREAVAAAVMVSPPTRGWTPVHGLLAHLPPGFPAHAGMDLPHVSGRRLGERFPRPRGDGPVTRGGLTTARRVSPPTRGWTRGEKQMHGVESGFPAHAGMDPSRRASGRWRSRFPRPRGDGPLGALAAVNIPWVSPPTRGWTRPTGPGVRRPVGFPAHAGMDPSVGMPTTSEMRFPRPRGDGPRFSASSTASPAVSPPTRGWTAAARRHAE